MLDMLQAALEQVGDVLIVKRVKDVAANAAHPHQAHLAQAAQLMGHGRGA